MMLAMRRGCLAKRRVAATLTNSFALGRGEDK
jgi:hypothetical protein